MPATDAGALAEWSLAKQEHDLMLSYYRKKQWDQARKLSQQLKGEFDSNMDLYYESWIERIEEMRQKELPENWDGTYVATSK